jgi:hypothetical protein
LATLRAVRDKAETERAIEGQTPLFDYPFDEQSFHNVAVACLELSAIA